MTLSQLPLTALTNHVISRKPEAESPVTPNATQQNKRNHDDAEGVNLRGARELLTTLKQNTILGHNTLGALGQYIEENAGQMDRCVALKTNGWHCKLQRTWESDAPAPGYRRQFTFADTEAPSLDHQLSSDTSSWRLAFQMFEGLFIPPSGHSQSDAKGAMDIRFGAAIAYARNAASDTYRVFLRPQLQWSDGNPITAHDFVYSTRRALTKSVGAEASSYMRQDIAGAKNFHDSQKDFAQVGVRALNAQTLEYRLANADHEFPQKIAGNGSYLPVPKHAIEQHGKQWTRPGNIVCSGAYCLSPAQPNDGLVLDKSPRYWRAHTAQVESIRLYYTNRETAAQDWFLTGKIMWSHLTPPTIDSNIDVENEIRNLTPVCTYAYAFNVERPPFDDVRVRQAFSLAVDRGKLRRQVWPGYAESSGSQVPRNFAKAIGYRSPRNENAVYDTARAKKLLAEAGYGESGKPFPEIELLFNTKDSHRLVADFLARSLSETLGISVKPRNMEYKSLLQHVDESPKQFDLARAGWCPDWLDETTYLLRFRTGDENNHGGYSNPTYDRLLDQLAEAKTPEARKSISAKLERILNTDVVEWMLMHTTYREMLHPSVSGFAPNLYRVNTVSDIRINEVPGARALVADQR